MSEANEPPSPVAEDGSVLTVSGQPVKLTKPRLKERQVKGIPSSPGIAIGTAVVIPKERYKPRPGTVAPEKIPSEQQRYKAALRACAEELEEIITSVHPDSYAISQILNAQLLILRDEVAEASIEQRIDAGVPAENAIVQEYDVLQSTLARAKDPILRERAVDLENVKLRLLAYMQNKRLSHRVPRRSILVTVSLTPTQLMQFHDAGMLGFLTELSGIASHASIVARSLGIPAVIGLQNVFKYITSGKQVIIDGYAGVVIVDPRPETVAKYERRLQELESKRKRRSKLMKAPAKTLDGRKVSLNVNADSTDDIDVANAFRADGIGLVRTESMIFRLGRFPSEDEQMTWYTEMAERAYPLPVTIRAFDVGGDKPLETVIHEPNPALGLRGLRYLLLNKKAFRAQINAVLRASQHRNIRFMLPMVTSVEEFQKAQAMIEKRKAALLKAGVSVDERLPLGAMIETPSAALMANELATLADFLSIGTNDLTQYTLAADRVNAQLSNIFDSFNPAVLRLIQQVCTAAREHGTSVSLCGEFAGHAAATELLIGLGIDELSVVPPLLLELKRRIRKTSYTHAVQIAGEVVQYSHSRDIRKRIRAVRTK